MSQQAIRAAGFEGWLGAILLAIVGGLIGTVPSSAPQSQRPMTPTAEAPVVDTLSSEGALVRSWEDPLGAAKAAILASKGAGSRSRWNGAGDLIIKGPDGVKDVSVFAVEMSDSPKAEGEEDRMRTRQAVIAALHRLGYAPSPRWRKRVDYVEVQKSEGGAASLGSIMAYEWWEPDPTRGESAGFDERCLVLWLGPRVMRIDPEESSTGLDKIVQSLRIGGEAPKGRWYQAIFKLIPTQQLPRRFAATRIIQLRGGSDNLRASVLEWLRSTASTSRVVSINATSTADLGELFVNELKDRGVYPPGLAALPERQQLEQWMGAQGKGTAAASNVSRVQRVLGSDQRLLDRMVNEMELRGIQPQGGRCGSGPL